MIKIKEILAPTDFSERSQHALKYAAELARRFDAKLHLLNVIEHPVTVASEMVFEPQRVEDERTANAKALQDLSTNVVFQGIATSSEALIGVTDLEILRVAKARDVDLLVIATHGRTGLAHLFMGSVAERLIQRAKCPVLTVRPEGHQFVSPTE